MKSKRTRRSASVAAVTLAGLGVLSVGLSTPASAATGTAVQSQVGVKSAGISGAESISEFLAKRVLGQAASAGLVSLFNLLTGAGTGEDPNAKDFAEIKDQLTDIQGQLGNMDAQLNALTKKFNKGEYAADLRELKASGNQVNQLYMTYFMPITAANQKLIDDQAAGADAATIEADRDAIAQRVEAFKNVYQQNFGVYGALADSIHDYLVPGANSVLEHRGAVMMDKGYLTATDSDALRAEYDLWADYQGIAALMGSFNDHLINPDDTAAIARLTRWENKRDQEQAALPTRIGNGTIVATPNGTTKGAKVYVAPAGKAQSWLPSTMIFPDINSPVVNPQDEGLDWAGTAASEISPRDADGNLIPGGSDWSLWSDADAKELTAAVADVSGQSVGAQLDAWQPTPIRRTLVSPPTGRTSSAAGTLGRTTLQSNR